MSRRAWLLSAGALLGAFALWAYGGRTACTSGGCAITGNPVVAALYGAVVGALLTDTLLSFGRRLKEHDNNPIP